LKNTSLCGFLDDFIQCFGRNLDRCKKLRRIEVVFTGFINNPYLIKLFRFFVRNFLIEFPNLQARFIAAVVNSK